MKNTISVSIGFILLTTSIVLGFLIIARPALAQVDSATSSSASSTTAPEQIDSSTTTSSFSSSIYSATAENDTASTSSLGSTAADVPSSSTAVTQPAPEGLTLVHIIGTKYIDYFTDGTSEYSFPGDPDIDSHFN